MSNPPTTPSSTAAAKGAAANSVRAAAPSPAEMSGLRAHAARWRRRQNRLAVALVIVMTLGALAVYLPLRNTLAQTRENIRTTEDELAANRDRASALPALREAVEALERQVAHYKPLRSLSADLGAAMQELSEIKERVRPENYSMDGRQPQKRHPSCVEQPLRMTFEADFIDAIAYISQVEAMDRLTRIRDVSITRKDTLSGKGGRVSVSMSLSLFFADGANSGLIADANGGGR